MTTKEIQTKIACGEAIETLHFDASGALIRRDVKIIVDKGLIAQGHVNLFDRVINGLKAAIKTYKEMRNHEN